MNNEDTIDAMIRWIDTVKASIDELAKICNLLDARITKIESLMFNPMIKFTAPTKASKGGQPED